MLFIFIIDSVIFVFGLIIGSFLNVVIRRGAKGEGLGGRSHCESCLKQLAVAELIPVLSFILQKGRCRSCGIVFSRQYPIVESATAISFVIAFWLFGSPVFPTLLWLKLILLWIGISAGIVIIISDFQYRIIPNGATLLMFLAGAPFIFWRVRTEPKSFLYDFIVAAFLTLFFWLLWFASKGNWMGFGDVKLTLALSLAFGFPVAVLGILFSFWLGGIYGSFLLLTRRKKLRSRVAFGPFLVVGMAVAYFAAPKLISTSFSFLIF